MSMMCKMNSSCKATPGMYVHEKMMATIAMLIIVGLTGYWFFA